MKQHVFDHVSALNKALTEAIAQACHEAILSRGQFNWVLSGGHSPQRLYRLLSSKTYKDRLDWRKVFFFFGDERFVPSNDDRRNSLMAKKTLFDDLNIDDAQIFTIDTSLSPGTAAQDYFDRIKAHFKQGPLRFDFVLLGLGPDAHTASLFPSSPVLDATEATVRSVFLKQQDMYRITMTAPLINLAKHIAFLVIGKDKAEAVAKVLEGNREGGDQYPATLIDPEDGEVHWYLDRDAASHLKPRT